MTYNEHSVPDNPKLTVKQRVKQFLCWHKKGKYKYFQSKYYADIYSYKCIKCGWRGYI